MIAVLTDASCDGCSNLVCLAFSPGATNIFRFVNRLRVLGSQPVDKDSLSLQQEGDDTKRKLGEALSQPLVLDKVPP